MTKQENKASNPKTVKSRKVDLAKALQLRLVNKLTYDEIAKQFGCRKSTVHAALSKFDRILREPAEIESYEKHKASLLSSAEMTILEKIVDAETVAKASLNNAAYAFTALHTAGRLERGKSTANIDMRQLSMTLSELQEEQKKLEKELELSNA